MRPHEIQRQPICQGDGLLLRTVDLPSAPDNCTEPWTQELSGRILVVRSMLKHSLMPRQSLETTCPDSISRTFPSSPSVSPRPYLIPCTATKGLILYSPPAAYTPSPTLLQALKIKNHFLMLFIISLSKNQFRPLNSIYFFFFCCLTLPLSAQS